MNQTEGNTARQCLAHLVGIFIGSMLGWALFFLSPDFASEKITASDIGARFYGLAFGLYGWGIAIVIGQNKSLFCGGTKEFKSEDRSRLSVFAVVSLALLIVGAASLVLGHYRTYSVIWVILMFGFLGEVGWANPLYFFKKFINFFSSE